MGDGLKRAFAATRATRTGKCPACERVLTTRLNGSRVLVMSIHGPMDSRCPGSGKPPKEAR
jgi:hypothetical protein